MGKLILLIGILLVGLVSIETLMYYNNVFDSLNKSSEVYFILKNIQYVQPFLIFFVVTMYFLLTPVWNFLELGRKFNHDYDEPKMLGSKKFRKTVRIFIFIQFILMGNFDSPGGWTKNKFEVMSNVSVILFGILLILISRLIQKSSEILVNENNNKEIN